MFTLLLVPGGHPVQSVSTSSFALLLPVSTGKTLGGGRWKESKTQAGPPQTSSILLPQVIPLADCLLHLAPFSLASDHHLLPCPFSLGVRELQASGPGALTNPLVVSLNYLDTFVNGPFINLSSNTLFEYITNFLQRPRHSHQIQSTLSSLILPELSLYAVTIICIGLSAKLGR